MASNMLGNGLSMLIGPALVHVTPNTTGYTNGSTMNEIRDDIDTYMQLHAEIAVFLFVLFIIYFPSKPPHPPAPSSAIERTEFWGGMKALVNNRNVWFACFAYSISQVSNSLFFDKH